MALLLVLLLTGAWLARGSVLGALAERVLASQGLGPAEIEVVSLSPTHTTLALRASAIGAIERIDVDYRLGLGLHIERVRISGARLQLAWRDGQLLPRLTGNSGDSGGPMPSMSIELVDTRLALELDTTRIDAELAGQLHTGAQASAQLRFALDAPQGHARGTLAAQSVDANQIDAALALTDGAFTLGDVRVQGLSGQLHARHGPQGLAQVDGKLNVQTLASAQQSWGAGSLDIAQDAGRGWQLDLRFTPLSLTATFRQADAQARRAFTLKGALDAHFLGALLPSVDIATGRLQVAAEGDLPANSVAMADVLRDGSVKATLKAKASDVILPEVLTLDSLSATLACALAATGLTCGSDEGLHLDGINFAAGRIAKDNALAGPGTLSLSAQDHAPLLEARRVGDGGELSLRTRLSLHTPRLSVQAPLAARVNVDALTPAATRGGRFTLQGQVDAEQPPGQAWLAPQFVLEGHYSVDSVTLALLSAVLDTGTLKLPQQGVTAQGLHAQFEAAATHTLAFTIGELRSSREPALFTPLKAAFKARISNAHAELDAQLDGADGRIDVALKAMHNRRNGQGEAKLVVRPIVLAGQDSVRALAPAFAASINAASGEVHLGAGAQWGAGPLRSQLALQLRDIALAYPAFKVTALDAHLDLDSLAPLHSVAGQRLHATFELPALKTVPFDVRFNIADQHLVLEHARAEVFNGAFETSDGAVDIASGASHIDLRVVDVDLAAVFTVLNLEQLKGSGRVSGHLPLRLEGGHIAVEQGQMQASGPGVVQVGASALTEQLQAHGKDVDLAFRALSDFHYDSLSISADKPLLGAGKALFHLKGNNPAVMDGQPFNFNISLETDFDYLAALLLQLSGITNSALGWSAGEMLKQ